MYVSSLLFSYVIYCRYLVSIHNKKICCVSIIFVLNRSDVVFLYHFIANVVPCSSSRWARWGDVCLLCFVLLWSWSGGTLAFRCFLDFSTF